MKFTPVVLFITAWSLAAVPAALGQDVRQVLDVPVAKAGDFELGIDLFVPKADAPPPLVVFIHGGGWQNGSRKQDNYHWVVSQGFALANLSYRLTDKASFPAQIHDLKAAIRWLRAHSKDYGYDATKIAAAGMSAGGHLAVLLGVSNGMKELEGDLGGNLDQSSQVQAILDYYGPTDFILRAGNQAHRTTVPGSVVYKLLGGSPLDKPDLARLASPAFHVTPDDPPLIIFHGGKDKTVYMDQTERLRDEYQKAGLPVAVHVLPESAHGGKEFVLGANQELALAFLNRHLRAKDKD